MNTTHFLTRLLTTQEHAPEVGELFLPGEVVLPQTGREVPQYIASCQSRGLAPATFLAYDLNVINIGGDSTRNLSFSQSMRIPARAMSALSDWGNHPENYSGFAQASALLRNASTQSMLEGKRPAHLLLSASFPNKEPPKTGELYTSQLATLLDCCPQTQGFLASFTFKHNSQTYPFSLEGQGGVLAAPTLDSAFGEWMSEQCSTYAIPLFLAAESKMPFSPINPKAL